MVTWTSPQLSSHMSGLVHWVHVWLHSCLPCHNHRVSVYNANKTLLKLFPLWRGWEKQQHVRDVMIPRCDGTGDNVAEHPSASWSLFLWNIGCYTLQKAKETCLGTDKEKKNCGLSHSTFIYRFYPGSLKALLTVTETQYTMTLLFPVNQQAYCIDI